MIDVLGQFHCLDDADRENWSRITDFVAEKGLAAFSRDPLIGGHVTGSAFVLNAAGTHVLLTHHAKLKQWLQLGGHCDGVADMRFTALREAYEESGLARVSFIAEEVFAVGIHDIPANAKEPAHIHYDIRFLMRAQAGEIQISDESLDLAWKPLAELEQHLKNPGVLGMRDRLLTPYWQAKFAEDVSGL